MNNFQPTRFQNVSYVHLTPFSLFFSFDHKYEFNCKLRYRKNFNDSQKFSKIYFSITAYAKSLIASKFFTLKAASFKILNSFIILLILYDDNFDFQEPSRVVRGITIRKFVWISTPNFFTLICFTVPSVSATIDVTNPQPIIRIFRFQKYQKILTSVTVETVDLKSVL